MPPTVAELDPAPASVAAERPQATSSICAPQKGYSETCLSLLIFLGSLAYLYFLRQYTTIEPDEGIVLEGAQRILHGQVLYRDFFSFLTPGSYYLTAYLFKIFGSSFLVARTALVFFGSCNSWVTYALTRRACSRRISLLVAGLVTVNALPYRFLTLHNWDSTFCACLAVYFAVRLLESAHWGWGLALGSSLSLTFLFEQSKGAGLLLGLAVGLAVIAYTCQGNQLLNRANLTALGIGLVLPMLLAGIYFATQHALGIMLHDWAWPLQHYGRANRVPYGFQNWSHDARQAMFGSGSIGWRAFYALFISASFIVPVLPLIAVILLAYWVIHAGKGLRHPKANYYVIVSAAISGLLLSVVIGRADIIHFMYLLPLLGVLLGWIIDGQDIPGRFGPIHPFLRAYLVAAFTLFSLPLLMRAATAPHHISTRRGIISTTAEDTVIPYVQNAVNPGKPLLVYPYLPLYNYLTDTYGPTHYEYFQPGMNTSGQATELLAELKSQPVPRVLFEPAFVDKISNSWPATPLHTVIHDPVVDYIKTHYRPCERLTSAAGWHFLFMVRKDTECPR